MKAGSLCTGIGGLDLAVEAFFGAELAWYSEVEKAPCTVLEREWPDVSNLGDLTKINWRDVPPVDVLTAGYPCQPFSHAGKRKGSDDERHLWPHIAEAVRVLRPRWVVLENVAGHLSLGFGDVLRDLAEAGFDAEWCVLRASDVGACHQRARVFIVATDTDERGREGRRQGEPTTTGHGREGRLWGPARAGQDAPADASGPRSARGQDTGAGRGDAPSHRSGRAESQRGHPERGAPADADGGGHGPGQDPGGVGRVDRADAPGARQRERSRAQLGDRSDAAPAHSSGMGRGSGAGLRPSEPAGERRRRPSDDDGSTPADTDGSGLEGRRRAALGCADERPARSGRVTVDWGDYEPAIRRWEHILGRPAPRPVDARGRLAPAFVEWMMGYPAGWVDGLSRTQALKALGNAVVPQQGYAALCELVPAHLEERAA